MAFTSGIVNTFNKIGQGIASSFQKNPIKRQGYDPVGVPTTSGPVEAYSGANADTAAREADIQNAFAQMRAGNMARGDVAKREGMKELQRKEAAMGGFGGASIRMGQKGAADINANMAAQEADIGAQESGALQSLKGEAVANKLAADQFGKTLQFQTDSFNRQMAFNWAEMDENKRTNLVNAAIALKDAGFLDKNMDELANLYKSGFDQIYQGRLPSYQAPFRTDTPRQPNPAIHGGQTR